MVAPMTHGNNENDRGENCKNITQIVSESLKTLQPIVNSQPGGGAAQRNTINTVSKPSNSIATAVNYSWAEEVEEQDAMVATGSTVGAQGTSKDNIVQDIMPKIVPMPPT